MIYNESKSWQAKCNTTATRYVIEAVKSMQTITVTFAKIYFMRTIKAAKYLANTRHTMHNKGKKEKQKTICIFLLFRYFEHEQEDYVLLSCTVHSLWVE